MYNSRMIADRFYDSETYYQPAPEGTVTVTFVKDKKELLEIFVSIGRAGSTIAAWANALQDTINYLLAQHLSFDEILGILSNLTSGQSVKNHTTGVVCRSGPEAVYICCLRYMRSKMPQVDKEDSLEYSEPFNVDDIIENG